MADPRIRTVEEIEEMTAGIELEQGEAMTEAAGQAGREYIDKMLQADNQVLQNPYGEPIVEIIVPRDAAAEVEAVIEEWDLNPSGHGVMAQAPSFKEDKPEVAQGLTAWQFLLTDDDGEELGSCGYDIEKIVAEIEELGASLLMTKAPRVKCSLPVE